MSKFIVAPPQAGERAEDQRQAPSRRIFLHYAGITAATAALVLTGCKQDDEVSPSGVDLGSGDVGVLNYAYAL